MTIEQVMLDEARRGVARQEANVDTLRTRTMAVFSVSALAFSLIGSRRLDQLDLWAYLAFASFVLSGGIAVWIIRPQDFAFNFKIGQWMDKLDRASADPSLAQWHTARGLAGMHEKNKVAIDRLTTWYSGMCALLVLQFVFWMAGGAFG